MAQQRQQHRWSHITWKLCRIDGWVVWRFFNLLLPEGSTAHMSWQEGSHSTRENKREARAKKNREEANPKWLVEKSIMRKVISKFVRFSFLLWLPSSQAGRPSEEEENLLDFGSTCSSRSWVRMEIDVDRSRLLVFSVFYSVPQDSRFLLCFFVDLVKKAFCNLFVRRETTTRDFPHSYSRIFPHTSKTISRRWQCERIPPFYYAQASTRGKEGKTHCWSWWKIFGRWNKTYCNLFCI